MQAITRSQPTRADGWQKVTGAAQFSGDLAGASLTHAMLVQSTIARGTITSIDSSAALGSPGVVAVFTHENLPPLLAPPEQFTQNFPAERRPPLSDATIHYGSQHVAIVIGETLEAAQSAAQQISVSYTAVPPSLDLRSDLPGIYKPAHFATNFDENLQSSRGDPEAHVYSMNQEYLTPVVHHNPMETCSTVAAWDGEELTLHDSTRWVQGSRRIVAYMLGVAEEKVRVLAPFVGGAFGSKGFLWQHVALAAQAARTIDRPVKLALTRPQMFTSAGHRPRTRQKLKFGADRDGRLTMMDHATLTETSEVAHFVEPAGMTTRNLYQTPHARISHKVVPTSLATPCFMRAPGESPGMFALESAMDELAEAVHLDPLEFRMRNYADRDLQDDRPWSSKHLRECYEIGATRFGWSQRAATPGSMRSAEKLIGWGMATAAYPARRSPVTVEVRLDPDGVATFSAATHEIGGGTATVMEQVAAEVLGFPIKQIKFVLGDSEMTEAPINGASQTAASVGSAVREAAARLRHAVLDLAVRDRNSPFFGSHSGKIVIDDGVLLDQGSPQRKSTISDLLTSTNIPGIVLRADAKLGDQVKEQHTFHSFGVHFAEVEFDPQLATLRVVRWVSVIDGGRILNAAIARSQIVGGIIFGIGMALMEETIYDKRTGMPVNADLAEYLVPTCADIPEIDITFVEQPDYAFNPLGIRGIGEIGITGVPAAIANAVRHATGLRVRSLPITIDKLLLAAT